ncbi:MAG: hypothetical protein A2157_05380 [Deltaproteobacteria bacterium RBG_16_47_11]|nr:MAG: hypothetical protein A2157_05380 [Deltaproteobacteria bacterium RBG_16_47_11]
MGIRTGEMEKNSILFLTNAYPDFETSYHGIFIKKMASFLQKEGYQISIVTPKIYKESHWFEEQDEMQVYRFPFFSGNRLLIEYRKIPYLRMIFYYLTGFILTVYVLVKKGCDLIHVHWAIPTGLIGVWVASFLKKPLIVTIHGSDLRMAMESSGLLRKVFLYVCRKANHLNCVSEVQKKEVEKLGITQGKISAIPMGVDEAFLDVGENRKEERNKQAITIFSNRNLLPNYNVSLLIDAIPKILREEPKIRLIIAGAGEERENLEKQVKRLKVSPFVQFLGQVPHQEMRYLLAQSDIYVSTSFSDGTSVSLLEAMGAGVFPVVSDIPANREWIVNGKNGFLIPVDEEGHLANRIIQVIRNQALLKTSRERNLFIIREKAIWPVNIRKVKELYTELLKT